VKSKIGWLVLCAGLFASAAVHVYASDGFPGGPTLPTGGGTGEPGSAVPDPIEYPYDPSVDPFCW